MPEYPPVLILDTSATGIAVARILKSHGVDVYGADHWSGSIGNYSKYILRPSFGCQIDSHAFVDKLLDFSKQWKMKPVLVPCADVFIDLVSQNFEILRNHFQIQDSLSMDISENFLNKRKFYALCDSYGVIYPKTVYLTGEERIADIMGTMRFPLILKPNLIHKWKQYLSGNKVLIIENEEKLSHVFSLDRSLLSDSMIQEVIPGTDENIFLFKGYSDRSGKLRSYFTGRKIRQYPPHFGSASLAESVWNEDVYRLSKDFLEKLKFSGLCGTEFKYDARDKIYKMIEINIRPQLWEDLTRIAECEVVWTMYCDLAGLNVQEITTQKNGVKWCYFVRDLVSSAWYMRRGELAFKDWMLSYRHVKADAILDLSDWKLSLMLPAYAFQQFCKYKVKSIFQRAG